jgi:hypothetical protein
MSPAGPAQHAPGMNERSTRRQSILDPVDRVSEVVFGLLMALSFTGAISAATAGRDEVRTILYAALGCNLAWGLVDAVMYLVRAQVSKGHDLDLLRAIRACDDDAQANSLIVASLPAALRPLLPTEAVDAIRRSCARMPEPPLDRRDVVAALAVFVVVVLSTFPVAIPFMLIDDTWLAMRVSNGTALVMLFAAGFTLGRHAGTGTWRTGLWMVGLGVALTGAIIALGG